MFSAVGKTPKGWEGHRLLALELIRCKPEESLLSGKALRRVSLPIILPVLTILLPCPGRPREAASQHSAMGPGLPVWAMRDVQRSTLITAMACTVELLTVGGMGHMTLAIKGISGGHAGCSKGKLLVALVLEEVMQSWRVGSSER